LSFPRASYLSPAPQPSYSKQTPIPQLCVATSFASSFEDYIEAAFNQISLSTVSIIRRQTSSADRKSDAQSSQSGSKHNCG
jgi:hypothetical protein